ncbi:MAG TPA: ASCH domain-containing protein [Methanothrix sp.]|nr:ASCH domain-containing protein [Methanothrix sp.]
MILFQPEHVEMIRTGRKTQTRRLWKRPRAKVGSIQLIKTQMISPLNFGSVEVMNVYHEPLGSMTDADAKAEGYDTLEEFRAVWERINGPGSWDPETWVYVVEFAYLGGE